jgi:class 3 adenylate cyclase
VTWPVRSEKAEKIMNIAKLGAIGVGTGAITWPFAGPTAALLAAGLAKSIVVAGHNIRERKRYRSNMEEVTKRIEEINEEGTKKYMDLQDAKQRLDKRYHEAQILDESARLIQSSDDMGGINRTALKTVCTQFGFTRAFIMVTDEDGRTLKTVAIDGVSENSSHLWQFRVDVSTKRENALFLSSAYHSGQAVVINDLEAHIFQLNDQSQKVIKAIGGAKGFTIIPIPDAKGSCGVLIAERDTEKFPIRQEDVVILQRLCQHIGIAIERFGKLEKEQKLRTLFQKYVPQAVLDSLLLESTPVLGGIQKEITCMFLDIRGFTHMSATLPPKVVIDILNRVFTVVGKMVERSGGVIDKFLGDGLLAVWGTIPGGKVEVGGILNEIQGLEAQLGVLNREFEAQGLPVIRIGIGLHKGPAIVGNIGSVDRLEFTCIGQAVNLASRLEGLCKQFNTNLVLSEQTFPEAAGLPTFRRIDDVEIRGLDKKISIFVQDSTNKSIN